VKNTERPATSKTVTLTGPALGKAYRMDVKLEVTGLGEIENRTP